uniref:hypothetical protein n=1 Tax=Ferrimicrobium acidiphilum TaxID=121039 RepID=UPI0023F536CC
MSILQEDHKRFGSCSDRDRTTQLVSELRHYEVHAIQDAHPAPEYLAYKPLALVPASQLSPWPELSAVDQPARQSGSIVSQVELIKPPAQNDLVEADDD